MMTALNRHRIGLSLAIGAIGLIGIAGYIFASDNVVKVYTVSEIQAGLHNNPQFWRGRTVLVRGVTIGVSVRSIQWGAIVDQGSMGQPLLPMNAPGSTPELILTKTFRKVHSPLPALLRLPLVGPVLTHVILGSALQSEESLYQIRLLPPPLHCTFPPKAAPCPDGTLSTLVS